ncbi:hypothetical protein IQ235_17170 [Oscillatoriales cyanobacterium LEGE 11467]|uniref:Uncharacterized protein n=1 Tax=Zarconia navalis LEGE 11467 TaxID=1828826 RepID=A0A928Z9C3_9CYAN|nr:hypothetical protein [Zarconia navalis]MBE9042505.1 hypothetical protein [Zarconia navalis LEGE 11467]
MSTTSEKSSKSGDPKLLSTQALVLMGVAIGVSALLFYLLFSVSLPGESRPYWYGIGTLLFEQVGFLFATFLCLRNGLSNQIVSGRNVWMGIGLGMLCYFTGNLFFSWWELYWELDPAVSFGDLFYLSSYVFLSIGMFLAVRSRRLNLELWQWGVTAAIAAAGMAFAVWIAYPLELGVSSDPVVEEPVMEEVAPETPEVAPGAIDGSAAPQIEQPIVSEATETAPSREAPAWVLQMETELDTYSSWLTLAYVVLDVVLLVVATLLLLAFWGGRFSQSWRMIAAAAFSLYIADMWYKYAEKNIPNYESGDLLEVFWVFTGVFFAIGAVLEYDVSTKSSSRRGRRRGGS